jgi:hypothetical protein
MNSVINESVEVAVQFNKSPGRDSTIWLKFSNREDRDNSWKVISKLLWNIDKSTETNEMGSTTIEVICRDENLKLKDAALLVKDLKQAGFYVPYFDK